MNNKIFTKQDIEKFKTEKYRNTSTFMLTDPLLSLVTHDKKENKVKLEIGSSVRPDPYSKKTLKLYIHEFLEENGVEDDIVKYEFSSETLNVLNIERTFIDKIMSVKRHAICGSLDKKARHIYDVVRLFKLQII